MSRSEGETSASGHCLSKVSHEWVGLSVQVAKHLIRVPPAHKANNVSVDMGAEECHGTTCVQTVCRYI